MLQMSGRTQKVVYLFGFSEKKAELGPSHQDVTSDKTRVRTIRTIATID